MPTDEQLRAIEESKKRMAEMEEEEIKESVNEIRDIKERIAKLEVPFDEAHISNSSVIKELKDGIAALELAIKNSPPNSHLKQEVKELKKHNTNLKIGLVDLANRESALRSALLDFLKWYLSDDHNHRYLHALVKRLTAPKEEEDRFYIPKERYKDWVKWCKEHDLGKAAPKEKCEHEAKMIDGLWKCSKCGIVYSWKEPKCPKCNGTGYYEFPLGDTGDDKEIRDCPKCSKIQKEPKEKSPFDCVDKCKYYHELGSLPICKKCKDGGKFVTKEKEPETKNNCNVCKHKGHPPDTEPCQSCFSINKDGVFSNFEEKEPKPHVHDWTGEDYQCLECGEFRPKEPKCPICNDTGYYHDKAVKGRFDGLQKPKRCECQSHGKSDEQFFYDHVEPETMTVRDDPKEKEPESHGLCDTCDIPMDTCSVVADIVDSLFTVKECELYEKEKAPECPHNPNQCGHYYNDTDLCEFLRLNDNIEVCPNDALKIHKEVLVCNKHKRPIEYQNDYDLEKCCSECQTDELSCFLASMDNCLYCKHKDTLDGEEPCESCMVSTLIYRKFESNIPNEDAQGRTDNNEKS